MIVLVVISKTLVEEGKKTTKTKKIHIQYPTIHKLPFVKTLRKFALTEDKPNFNMRLWQKLCVQVNENRQARTVDFYFGEIKLAVGEPSSDVLSYWNLPQTMINSSPAQSSPFPELLSKFVGNFCDILRTDGWTERQIEMWESKKFMEVNVMKHYRPRELSFVNPITCDFSISRRASVTLQ